MALQAKATLLAQCTSVCFEPHCTVLSLCKCIVPSVVVQCNVLAVNLLVSPSCLLRGHGHALLSLLVALTTWEVSRSRVRRRHA